jgi:hypothetical protein
MAATLGQRIPVEADQYLRLHHIITLSTSSFTGMPHAKTVAYSNDEHCLYFAVPDGLQIVRNIRDSRHVSFTIDDYATDWRKVRELEGLGRCEQCRSEELETGLRLFAEKFGHTSAQMEGLAFAIRPMEMHFVDYTYDAVTADRPRGAPEMVSRVLNIGDTADLPSHAAVATSLNRRSFGEGEIIFRPGDAVGQYFIVLEGVVEIRGEGYGADQTVTRVGPGQLFGDQAALHGQRGALTAHAVNPTVLLAVPREDIRDLLMPDSG